MDELSLSKSSTINNTDNEREINVFGQIEEENTKEILEKIFNIKAKDEKILKSNEKLLSKKDHKDLEPVTVNIMSVGGCVFCTSAIYDALTNLKCNVITKGYGLCASGGLILLLAGNERYLGKRSRIVYHTMSYGVWHEKLQNHMDLAQYQNNFQKILDNEIIEKTSITQEQLTLHRKDDWWMTFEEALKYEIIHGEIK